MPSRILLVLSVVQVALIYLPPLTWTLWILHFAALEACLLASVTGLIAAALAKGGYGRGLGVLSALLAALPALVVLPLYWAEGVVFSPMSWLTGRGGAEVSVERNLPLLPGLSADLYRAPGPGPHPFVVVVHGGSWRSGDKGDVPAVSYRLANAGFSVVDVQYRLAGDAPFPAAIADLKCWLAVLRTQAGELGLDPERAALLGRSAGAQIALVSAWSDTTLPASCAGPPVTLRGVISLYGPTDLAWAHDHPFVPDVVDGPAAQELYLGGPPTANPEAWRLATPMTWVDAARPLPPTLLMHGTAERCVRASNAEKLHATLTAAGQRSRLLLVPMADHGFDVRPGGLGEQLSRGVLLDFLRAEL